jgi:hypothetical protein
MSKWDKYKVLLTEEHKKKLEPISKEFEEKKLIHNNLYDKWHEMMTFVCSTDEYKEINKMPTTNSSEHRLYQEARHNLYLKYYPDYFVFEEKLSVASLEFRIISNKLDRFKSAVYILYEIPEPKGTPTDDETKQCTICTVNLKDHALPCGHIYCVECIGKMKCECPTCKKSFVKSKAIKLFY